MVIHHDDLQFVRRIILIHTSQDGPLNPFFFIKAGNNNGHAGGIIHIHLHGTVKDGKEITGKKKRSGNNAV